MPLFQIYNNSHNQFASFVFVIVNYCCFVSVMLSQYTVLQKIKYQVTALELC